MGDITYIRTVLGWVYLAVVIDLYNREVIGYAISKKIDTGLVKRALGNALAKRTGSMSRGGCPYDNSCVESFFATLKKERIYRREYVTMEEVKTDIFSSLPS